MLDFLWKKEGKGRGKRKGKREMVDSIGLTTLLGRA